MSDNNKQKLNFKLAFLAFGLLLLLQIFVFSYIQLYFQELAGWKYDLTGGIITIGADWGIWVGLIITEAAIGLIIMLIFYYRGISIKDLFKNSKNDVKFILIGTPLVFIIGIGASYIQLFVMNIFQIQYPESIDVLTQFLTPNNGFELSIWITIMILIVAPCEELFARGCIQKGFQNSLENRDKGQYLAIIGSSICFMIFHIDPFRFFPIFCESVAIGYMYYKSDSLSSVIWIHGFLNTILILLSIFGI